MTLFLQPAPDANPETLRRLCLDYNWNDGFAFPRAIADHPNCDLAVALELFWVSDAISVYLGEATEKEHNAEWRSFCKLLTQRLLSGHYIQGSTLYQSQLTKTQLYKYRKVGVPELLLGDGQEA